MDDNKKRIIFAIMFIIACFGIGYLLYRVFFYKAPIIITPQPGVTTTGQFPTAEEAERLRQAAAGSTVLPTAGTVKPQTGQTYPNVGQQAPVPKVAHPVDTYIVSASKDKAGGAKFYNDTDGKFYRLDKNGNIKEMSDQIFYNVQKATWSPTADQAIIEYPDGSNIFYDFNTKKQVSLPKHWQEFSFAPQGDKIASKSMGLSPESQWLITSDPDGKNISLIEPMGENASQVTVDWSPNQQVVALSRTGEALGADREEVLFVGLNQENFKSAVVEGRGLRSQWSPEGKNLLYSVYSGRSDFKPELWIVAGQGDSIGANRKTIGLNTWADKCTFQSERFVYCAVPISLDTGAGFAPDIANYTADTIYKIDLQTGIKSEISQGGDTHTVNTMFTSPDGKTLYFTDKNQPGIFDVKL